jgi:hypothetical protein
VWAPTLVATHEVVKEAWYEISRPQIHGYELISAVLPRTPGFPHRLLSAGDEKVR